MYTGKMTATWLIIITMVSIVAVPLLIIYYAMILPFDQAHPEALAGEFILGLITLFPNVSTPGFISGILT
jgi:hypothetical protein